MRGMPGTVLLHALALAGAFLALVPLAWMVSASFMQAGEASTLPIRWVPDTPTAENYRALFRQLDLGRYLVNSVIVAVAATSLAVLLCGMAGYAFALLRFRGRDWVFRRLLLALVIPAQVGMLPLFLLLREMRLVNTYAGAIIPFLASVFGIFLIRQYVSSVPPALLQAARMDGAGEWRIFSMVVVPVIRPVLATFGTFTFLASWNDFMWPLIVLSDSEKYTLPVAVANLAGEHVQDIELMMAGSVLTVVPAVLVFLLFQRAYMRGIMGGGVKG